MTRLGEVVVIVVTEFRIDGVAARTVQGLVVVLVVVVVEMWPESPVAASAAEEPGTASADGMYFLHLRLVWGLRKQ